MKNGLNMDIMHDKKTPLVDHMTNDLKRQLKRELLTVFQKYGYLKGAADHEVTFRTTSGNIAWIHINRIEIIK